jgi:hypothetical protein
MNENSRDLIIIKCNPYFNLSSLILFVELEVDQPKYLVLSEFGLLSNPLLLPPCTSLRQLVLSVGFIPN